MTLADVLPDETSVAAPDQMFDEDLVSRIRDALKSLSPREETILRMRFGLDEGEAHTLAEVGDALDVTRERVRQIEARALRKLFRRVPLRHAFAALTEQPLRRAG